MATAPQFPAFIYLRTPTIISHLKSNTLTVSASPRSPSPNPEEEEEEPAPQSGKLDAVKLAFARAKAYKKAVGTSPVPEILLRPKVPGSAEIEDRSGGSKEEDAYVRGEREVPSAVKLAFQRAKEYKMNKKVAGTATGPNDKEGKQVPSGLVPMPNPFPDGKFPEVEILVGDSSKFGNATEPKPVQDDGMDVYKPKVSTWGVFPRPNNISKSFGGGRIIKPGEALETAEEKAAKDARTRELLAAYDKKAGLSVDPKLKLEYEKALSEGDSLMELGKLREAIPFYTKVMDGMPFRNELHGRAALQWSICQDSLQRPDEARTMYEKLQSHPSVQVRKKARNFVYSFEAMKMMKATTTTSAAGTDYQSYFDAFIKDTPNYPLKGGEVDEGGLGQVLPYIFFLVSPIFIVLLIAIQKGM
ncbi:unnamed protein product [Cuscuta campestris]|uniref:Uncharacterized protein n=1 Tax=Cuscuta campestris TaxID=132261 RepID=A0A484M6K5_9ASTE|nr:unnamed protein product [Cuscuta campestris]